MFEPKPKSVETDSKKKEPPKETDLGQNEKKKDTVEVNLGFNKEPPVAEVSAEPKNVKKPKSSKRSRDEKEEVKLTTVDQSKPKQQKLDAAFPVATIHDDVREPVIAQFELQEFVKQLKSSTDKINNEIADRSLRHGGETVHIYSNTIHLILTIIRIRFRFQITAMR